MEEPLADRHEALKVANLWCEKIPIGVIYRNVNALCRKGRTLFRAEIMDETSEWSQEVEMSWFVRHSCEPSLRVMRRESEKS